MKNRKILMGFLTLVLATASISCSNEEDQASKNLKIQAKATYSGLTSKVASVVSISEFKINLKKIEFKLDENYYGEDDDNYGDGFYGDDEEFQLGGPFELDLLNGPSTITSVNIPDGVYEEVAFKMQKSINPASELFNKSIQIKGTIDGVPFIFWHNVDESFEIDYEDLGQSLTIANNNATVVFDFNLDTVLAAVDLSVATDGNGDGIIEISPTDADGNNALAHLIKNKIKEAADLYDDNNNDGNDDNDDNGGNGGNDDGKISRRK